MNLLEHLVTFSTHEIRIGVHILEICFVAQDICEAFDLGKLHTALQVVDEQDKFLVPIETPFGDKRMWCVSEKGMEDLIARNGAHLQDRLWMALLPSRERLHRSRREEPLRLAPFDATAPE
jgi:prophage antirepressor-like protein